MRPAFEDCRICDNKGVARWGCPNCQRKRPFYPDGTSLEDRFWSKVVEEGGCMIWKGAIDRCGYGCFGFQGDMRRAHRVAWFLIYGEWPSMVLDHLCKRRRCVDVTHMEDVTIKTNVQRGIMKDVCKRGHKMEGENVYWYRGGTKRRCRACIPIQNGRVS